MGLTNAEQTAVRAAIARDGIDAVVTAARALDVSDRTAAATSAVSAPGVLAIGVSDWDAVGQAAAGVPASAIPSILQQIGAAVEAQDAAALGPLAIMLYGACAKHFGVAP